jgi:hypothetical protein
VQRDVDRLVDAVRQGEGPREIPACSSRDHSDLDLLALGDPVHDLVDRSVAADDDKEFRAVVHRAVRKLGELSGPTGEERVAV